MVTPLACGVEPTWQRLINGGSGARRIESFDVSDLPAKIACQVPRGDGSNGSFNPDQWMEPKEQRKVDDFIVFAMCAARQALDDAGWKPLSNDDQIKTGVMIGSGIGGLTGIAETAIVLKEKGPRRVSPFFIPGRLINLASGYVSIAHGLKGPNHAVVTACSTGAHAIGDAARLVALGDAEVMVAGGAESPISRIGMAGFVACRVPRSSAMDSRETLITSLRQPRMARGRCAVWTRQSNAPAFPRRRSTTSMPTAPQRRSATRSSSVRCIGWSGTSRPAFACRPPNRRSGICWAPPALSRQSSRSSNASLIFRRVVD